MPARPHRPPLLAALAGLALLAGGCGLTESASASAPSASGGRHAQVVAITMTDAGCAVSPATIEAGPVQFSVTNDRATKVSEAEFQDGGFVMGEQENLTPGLSGSFALTVDGGSGH